MHKTAHKKVCLKKDLSRMGKQSCMLPRELIWEEVAPPHNRMTQKYVPESKKCKALLCYVNSIKFKVHSLYYLPSEQYYGAIYVIYEYVTYLTLLEYSHK